jgi:hypothetical protein
MKTCGVTIIRNAILYDYPVVESILSVLPLVDELVVLVGNSEDGTLELIKGLNEEKIKIYESEWDDSKREGGELLAIETNKALKYISKDIDWIFYIQADELIHENDYESIISAMKLYQDDQNVDGLLFKYLHFYGSYDYLGSSSKWYQNEIRIIKNNRGIYSYKDAQGFRKGKSQKLSVKTMEATIYHYGWVKAPAVMQKKRLNSSRFWHDDKWIASNFTVTEEFDYSKVDQLKIFEGSHPKVMLDRIKAMNWKFKFDPSFNRVTIKEKLKSLAKKYLGLDFNYKNYKII